MYNIMYFIIRDNNVLTLRDELFRLGDKIKKTWLFTFDFCE